MRKLIVALALLTMVCVIGASTAAAMSHGASGPKVYWTASGLFGPFNIQGLIPTYPDARDIMIPINMWIIDHPKGLVVYDTGNNIAISDGACKTHWLEGLCDFLQPSQARGDVIDKQLEKVRLHGRRREDRHHLALPPGPHRQHRDVPERDSRDPEEGAVPGLVAGEVPARRSARYGRL